MAALSFSLLSLAVPKLLSRKRDGKISASSAIFDISEIHAYSATCWSEYLSNEAVHVPMTEVFGENFFLEEERLTDLEGLSIRKPMNDVAVLLDLSERWSTVRR